jgi:hypothetical protein
MQNVVLVWQKWRMSFPELAGRVGGGSSSSSGAWLEVDG